MYSLVGWYSLAGTYNDFVNQIKVVMPIGHIISDLNERAFVKYNNK